MHKLLKCYLSSILTTQYNYIKDFLMNNDVKIVNIFDSNINLPIISSLKKVLSDVDFAIFIINKSNIQNTNQYYEIGLCDGLNIPILIFADDDIDIGNYVLNHFFIKTKINDQSILKDTLINFIYDFKHNKKIYYNMNYKYNNKNKVNNLDEHISIESKIMSILNKNNIKYINNDLDRGADFILWNNLIQNYIGSPIILEIKNIVLNINNYKAIKNQLLNFMNKSDAKASILVSKMLSKDKNILYDLSNNHIYFVSIDDIESSKYQDNFIKSIFFNKNLDL